MQQEKGFKRFLPHLWVIGIFIVISCAFCYPAFQGNTLDQHDMYTWLWGSKESRDFYQKTGENALWANNMFSGMPQVLIDYYPETNWYNKIHQFVQFYTHGEVPNPASFFFLAMVSFYILMSVLKVNRWLGVIGAVAFAFSSYNPIIITAGHTTKMLDIAYIPAILGGVILAYKGKYLQGAALAGLVLAFFFDSGHYQIIYYGAIVIGVLVIATLVTAIRQQQWKQWIYASGCLLLAAGFAFLASASRIIQTQEYNPYSIRGGKSELTINQKQQSGGLDRDYAFQWSNGVGETFCILIPNLYGGASGENIGTESHMGQKLASFNVPYNYIEQITSRAPLYWGPQPMLSGPVYFGAVICLLVVLSLLVIRSPYKWWLAGVSLFFILLSMGKNFAAFNYFMFDYFPMYNKFRTPSMTLAIPSILFPIMAIWALIDVFSERITKEELWKKLRLSVIITGGLCLALVIAAQGVFDFKGSSDEQMQQQYGQMLQNPEMGKDLIQALRQDRASAATSDGLRSLAFILLAGLVLWAFIRNKIKKEMAIAGIGLLVAIDEIPVANRYLNESNFLDNDTYAMQFQPRPADAQILRDPDPYYRVFDITNSPFNDSKPSYFHKSIGGYHGAKMEIYQELIENQISKFNASVLDMLNTKYFILPAQKGEPMAQINPNACGNAWFVSDIKWAVTADEEMSSLNAPSLQNPGDSSMGVFRPLETAVLRETYKGELGNYTFGKDSTAGIKLTKYSPKQLSFESNNSQNGLAVFSDIYYPKGWTARIDGKETTILRANYVLRALPIPAGKHTIEFSFEPPSFSKGERLGLIGSVLLSLLIAAGLWATYKQYKTAPVAPEEPGKQKKSK